VTEAKPGAGEVTGSELLTTINVAVAGQLVNRTSVVNIGSNRVVVSQDKSTKIGLGFSERIDIDTAQVSLMVVSAPANKFATLGDRVRHMHLDLNFRKFDAKACTGALPEMWGYQPMSAQTTKFLQPV